MSRTEQFIVLALILAIGVSAFLFLILNPDRYTALAIKAGSYVPYTFNNITLKFFYDYPSPPIGLGSKGTWAYPSLFMETNNPPQGFNTALYTNATGGETYYWNGLEIKVLDLSSDHIVLLVKPAS
ncbi:MAG TPA: hypothetical protein VEH86_02900 [Candidatus Acidoferrum sp.]|nr:hypothetical protein [Candidatus Acidoferrum sp.]